MRCPCRRERWGKRLLATLPLRGDETVLDVGAGPGSNTPRCWNACRAGT